MGFLLGYDCGTSSIKATLLDAETGKTVAGATCPDKEMEMVAKQPGWAEQNPLLWWDNVKAATHKIKAQVDFDASAVEAVGISYQMHGLVVVDKEQRVLRPSIIWCDSRAVPVGEESAKRIGERKCLERLLNLPGNFTATRLKWLKDNEPAIYSKVHKYLLPGDYIAMKMTGRACTTVSGLSEAILWDFVDERPADFVLEDLGISEELIAEIVPTFGVQGELTRQAADELGLKPGTKVCYRAGDQPNNAFSLGVLNPGEVATTAGTSGVVYGIIDHGHYDKLSRVNVFVHVNHSRDNPRYGVLLCVSGTGILNSWLKHNFADSSGEISYEQMNELAAKAPPGCEGLLIYPYGNGAERTLENRDVGAAVQGWRFNVHDRSHFFRAAQEGIVFALNYGLQIMRDMGMEITTVRAGYANMFLSPVFADVFATVTGAKVELFSTDGSQGAARGAGVGAGIYKTPEQAYVGLEPVKTVEPDASLSEVYQQTYQKWADVLEKRLQSL